MRNGYIDSSISIAIFSRQYLGNNLALGESLSVFCFEQRGFIMSRLLVTVLIGALLCFVPSNCDGQCQRRVVIRSDQTFYGMSYPPAPYRYHSPTGYYSYQRAAELYPKYYGGFHARHFDNIGIPPGDVGLRGNGIYLPPW